MLPDLMKRWMIIFSYKISHPRTKAAIAVPPFHLWDFPSSATVLLSPAAAV